MKIIRRIFVILPSLFVEALLIALLVTVLKPYSAVIEGLLRVIAFLLALFVISYRQEGTYKILWILFFTAMPVAAAVCYLLWGNKKTVHSIAIRVEAARMKLKAQDWEDGGELQKLREENERLSETLDFVSALSRFTACACESVTYYPLGEQCWQAMLEAMEHATSYIYLEYFIVQDGLMWSKMTDVMARKVQEGVDVRVIYDDFGSLSTFTSKDTKKLTQMGVKWFAFNKLKFISGTLNNRSHRKMLIVDGHVAFSGGINIADEYINHIERFGHWKDIGFKITGPAVGNYVDMFAQFWNGYCEDKIPQSAFDLVPASRTTTDGIVLSYYDSPAYRDAVSNTMFIEMLGNAAKRAWFYTPYLMLGDTLMDAFVRAAARGVDVRIIMPGIPDKKMIFRLSRSFYAPLLEAGVRIFEYTPGFVHAKASLFDDDVCTVGTVNLDYRSLYLHFENNSLFVDSSIHKALEEDYLDTLSKCHEVTTDQLKKGLIHDTIDGVLRIFAPLC